jgi:hypothetical protein
VITRATLRSSPQTASEGVAESVINVGQSWANRFDFTLMVP